MNRQPVLDGDRLLLRPLALADWSELFTVASDPLIWAIHPAHERWQQPVFRVFFDDALTNGGAMAVIDRASRAVIGSSRWQGHDPADGGSVEIGWTFLARSHWGGSYNLELKRLMLAHAFQTVSRVVFRVGEMNMRSRRAMEKIGGRLTEAVEHTQIAGRDIVHVVYEITRETYGGG